MIPLENLKVLREDMQNNERAVVVFPFVYNEVKCFVAVCLLTEKEKRENIYQLVKLCFMHAENIDDYLDCYANSTNITVDITELRRFFKTDFQSDIFSWIKTFLCYLGRAIPVRVPQEAEEECRVAIRMICRYEGRDPYRIYRDYIRRNGKEDGKQKYRTEYNGQLAAMSFPILYKTFKRDRTISFVFTDDLEKEKAEETILADFIKREKKR